MKTKKLAIFLFTLIFSICMIPMSVFADPRAVANDSTASITVENAVENDELAAYKVIDISYDAATNHVSYAWNSDFANYFAGTTSYNSSAYTVEQFSLLTDGSANLKNLLAQLPNYIAYKSITPVDTQTVAAGGTAAFANLAMGEYFIRPTSTTSVYQLMLQKIEPKVSNGAYVIDDVTFTAKHEEAAITKTADKTSVTKNEKVAYTVTVDIPTYSAEATDKTFYVADLLPDGLTLDETSIKVQIDGNNVPASDYDLDTTANSFKVSVSTANYAASWSANGGKQLVIAYTATFNDNDTTEVNTPETNTATFDYSFYPYASDPHQQKNASVDVTTFAIKIEKYDLNDNTNKLAGAKFDLYRTAAQGETNTVEIPHTSIQGIRLEGDLVTGTDGSAIFAKYEANGTNYDYYLIETQAPSGYNLLSNAVKVNFTDGQVDQNGCYTVEIENSSGFKLPITGGAGTVLFTVIGIALMAGAVLLFVVSRRKIKN